MFYGLDVWLKRHNKKTVLPEIKSGIAAEKYGKSIKYDCLRME
jgi:hypothetical protein